MTEKNSKERARLHTANLARIAAVKGAPRETHNMTIKRYECFTGFQATNYDAERRNDGPWVSYDDHAEAIATLRADVEEARNFVVDSECSCLPGGSPGNGGMCERCLWLEGRDDG